MTIRIRKNTDIITFLILLFLAICMFFPVSYNSLKLAMILFLFIVSAIKRQRIGIQKDVVMYVLINSFFILYGCLMGAPGAIRVITVDVIYPLLFSFVFLSLFTVESIPKIIRLIIFMSTVIALFDLIYCISNMIGITLPSWYYLEELQLSWSNYYGYTHFTSSHLNVLFFGLPLTLTLLMTHNSIDEKGIPGVVSIVLCKHNHFFAKH